MKNQMKSAALFVLVALMQVVSVNAQIDTNRFRVALNPEDLGTCGGTNNSIENVFIQGKNASCHDFSITFTLPDGVEYVSGTAIITSQIGSGDFVITEGGSATSPIFTVQRPSDANWAVGDEVNFSFERRADCNAVQFLNSGGLFKDAHTINFVDAAGAQSETDDDVTVSAYSLLAASLNISAIPTINASVGDSYTRNVNVAQGGNGCVSTFTHYVTVGSDVDDVYSLSYGGVVLTPSITGNIYTYDIDLNAAPFNSFGGLGSCFDNGENMIFEESFRVDDCVDTAIVHNSFWGCNAGETCQAAAPQTGSLNFGASVPDVVLSRVDTANNTELCGTITYTVKIENTNTVSGAMALDVGINLGLGANGTAISTADTNTLWAFDHNDTRSVSNFRFESMPSFTPATSASTSYPTRGSGETISIPADFFTTDPDGPGGFDDLDNDSFFDDLPPGASSELSFDYAIDPKENCGTGRFDYMGWEHTYFDVFFKDQCKSDRLPERIDLNYFNIIRDYQSVTEVDAPTDVVDAENFTVSIAPSFFVGGTGSPLCDGTNMSSNAASSVWTVAITVPNGMNLQAGAPAEFTQIGNEITYATTDITSGNYKEWVDFPLTLTCGPNGIQTIPYTTNYTCTGASGVCWDQDIHCGSVQIYTHCPGACVGPSITDFDANRTTAGWTDSSMNTLVTLDENIHETKKYLAGDEMKVVTTADINNISLDNLYFDVNYQTVNAAAGGDGIISFIDGTITINDISGTTQTGSITVAPTLTTNGSTNHTLTFDLSSYRSLISGTYEYGEGLDTDNVEIELNFVFANDFTDITFFELSSFRGEFYAFTDYPTNTARVGCDTWGDRAFYSRPRISGSNQTQGTNGCAPGTGSLFWTHNMSSSDMYPMEYRPLTLWTSTIVDVPTGARFTGKVTSSSFEGAYSTDTGEFIANESNGQITITPGPGFVNRDQIGLHYPRFFVEFEGTCVSPPSTTYDYTVNYQDFAYSTPVAASINHTNTFTYSQPTFLLQSPLPTVNGDAFTVDFDVTLSNTSANAVNYNWLQVDVPTGLVIEGAFAVVGSVETPLTIHQAPGKLWVEAGAVATSSTANYRIKANFANCEDQTILVEHGWDCSGYPGFPDTSVDVSDFQALDASCYQRSTSITLEPKQAQVQMVITNQPSTPQDICTPFNIELDIISAQLADLVNPYVEFAIPGGDSGLTINSTTIEFPKNSGDFQTVTVSIANGLARINVMEHTAIASIMGISGNPGANSINARTAHIDLDLSLECDFISNSTLTFKVYGESPCGDPALGNGSRSVSNSIEANGAVAPYNALSTINLPGFGAPIQGCSVQETINVITTITGGTTGTQDFGLLTLIPGIEFVPGTFVSNGTHIATFESVSTVGDHEEITFRYPAGVPDGEIIEIDFDVITTDDAICDADAEIQIINYVEVDSVSCGGSTCSAFQVATGFSYEVLPLEKPTFIGTAVGTGSYALKPNGDYYYTFEVDLENTATIDAAAGYTFSAYCADINGAKIGMALGGGTFSMPIAGGTSMNETLSFSGNSTVCNPESIIIELEPSASNCQCETTAIVIPIAIAPPLTDTDNDGIEDLVDLDDDNDGIPDLEEGIVCVTTTDVNSPGFALNTNFAAGSTSPVSLNGLDNGTFDFSATVAGSASWNDGVQIQNNTAIGDFLYAQPENTDNTGTTNVATYTFDFPTPVKNFSFVTGGLNNNDQVTITAFLGGTQVPVTSANFAGLDNGVIATGNSVQGTIFDGSFDPLINIFTTFIPETIDRLVITAGKSDNLDTQVTIGLYSFGYCSENPNEDFDGDGIPNSLDLDSDNDGILDIVEAGGIDTDRDGEIDYPTPGDPSSMNDANMNGIDDDVENTPLPLPNSDALGANNYLDIDADDDGIPDNIEAQTTSGYIPPSGTGVAMTDMNMNGVDDAYENGGTIGIDPVNTDSSFSNSDTIPDYIDDDSDGDGINDIAENGNLANAILGVDMDNDGLDDAFDDNDDTAIEGNTVNDGINPPNATNLGDEDGDLNTGGDVDYRDLIDNDNDGIADIDDIDDDNDGIPDSVEGTGDSDNDGIPDYLDLDSDNDGITDVIEAGGTDDDGNGIIDGFVDLDNDGLSDPLLATPLPNPDSDEDGIDDRLDLDSDNDGIPDVVEAGGTDANGNGLIDGFTDTDMDGLADSVDPIGPAVPGTPLPDTNSDSDSVPDRLDVDSDNDGITDTTEAGGPDIDNDGRIDSFTDADNDGFDDTIDTDDSTTPAPLDGTGTTLPTPDFDNDGRPNYLDIDSDNDGLTDVFEAGGDDTDRDGEIDGFVDSDNDGFNDDTEVNPLPLTNTDSNGNPDYLDIDADDDGIVDNIEAQTTGDYLPPLNADDDMDGMDNQYDIDFVGTDLFGIANTDGDALPDYIDRDTDEDTTDDIIEGWDVDGDGTPDTVPANMDSDGDGLDDNFDNDDATPDPTNNQEPTDFPDVQDPGLDRDWRQGLDNDGDGILDINDLDDDNDGIPDSVEGNEDTDGDGIPDSLDLDSDNDGIPDILEAGGEDADLDGDGEVDYPGFDSSTMTDANNNGLEDRFETDPLVDSDSDDDGIPNRLDLDSDNDGIPDVTEAGGTDTDGDGIIDGYTDVDGDGFADSVDSNDNTIPGTLDGGTPYPYPNNDSDAIADWLDVDSDNDGLTDVTEAGGIDADNDGRIDGFTDADMDGFADSVDTDDSTTPAALDGTGTPLPSDDFDNDGRPNYLDIDSDNDGITDTTEAGGTDSDGNGEIDGFSDADNDGFNDATEATPLPVPNTDGSLIDGPDYLDMDADNDGLPDNIEAQPTVGYVQPNGTSAPNGLDTAYSTGLIPEDTDGDLIPDYLDTDSDNDGIDDLTEGGRGTLTDTDTDGDGLDDGFEGIETNDPFDVNDEIDDPTTLPDVQVVGGDVDYRQGLDADGDGVLDDQEVADGTDPNDPCDYEIASITEPQSGDWLLADCDGDGVTNEQEIADGTNPEDPCDFSTASVTLALSGDYLISDCDGDGVTNGTEINDGTDPEDPCDFNVANVTLDQGGDWLLADCDGDTIPNGQEMTDGTLPNDPCSSIGGTPPAGTPCDITIESDLVGPGLNNGIFQINNIENFPNNTVRIYNRWGVLVFETQGYDNGSNAFRGISNGRATINESEALPVGVYFYVIEYLKNDVGEVKNGYLYVNR